MLKGWHLRAKDDHLEESGGSQLYQGSNHQLPGRHRGATRDKLQKLDRPVLMTGCSQQDFRFFKEEWRRYTTAANTTEENASEHNRISCISQDDSH